MEWATWIKLRSSSTCWKTNPRYNIEKGCKTVWQCHPISRGKIEINSPDPFENSKNRAQLSVGRIGSDSVDLHSKSAS